MEDWLGGLRLLGDSDVGSRCRQQRALSLSRALARHAALLVSHGDAMEGRRALTRRREEEEQRRSPNLRNE